MSGRLVMAHAPLSNYFEEKHGDDSPSRYKQSVQGQNTRSIGMSPHEIAVTGDSENDHSLLHLAERPLAVATLSMRLRSCRPKSSEVAVVNLLHLK
jgi:phosphoserine phosphatase